MRQTLFVLLPLMSAFAGFTGCCYAWVDWIQDIKSRVYEKNYLEAVGETSAIGLYTYLTIRSVKRNVTL